MRADAMQRVLTTLGHREPDRVPLFLLLTMHGAKKLGLSIQDYFARPEHVVEGQLRLRAKFGHDCYYGFFHAALEIAAWGGEVVFRDDGPPNTGAPPIKDVESILRLVPPLPKDDPGLRTVLAALAGLKARSNGDAPIIGVVMSPFSLPAMQLGLDRYFELLNERRDLLKLLLEINQEFCVAWARAQLAAGATAICYFDPLASPSMVPRDLYAATGWETAKSTIARINGPTATHLASGRCHTILDLLIQTGTAAIAVSADENLADLKRQVAGRVSVIGNLNGIAMRHWSAAEAEERVKQAIRAAAPGGGFILADHHGEIPFQVPDDVLMAIAEAVRTHGRYPIVGADLP